MRILGIESSCDETAAAVVQDGRQVLSNVIATSLEEHKLYGGVVPEIASRRHAESISGVVRQALEAGASGYLTKNSAPQVLIEAVQRVLAGHAYIEQALATQLATQPQHARLTGLTQRETEIFLMLAKDIRTRLFKSGAAIPSRP